jgi:hypothetical protein
VSLPPSSRPARSARTPPIARMPRDELLHHRGHCDGSVGERNWAHAIDPDDWALGSAIIS